MSSFLKVFAVSIALLSGSQAFAFKLPIVSELERQESARLHKALTAEVSEGLRTLLNVESIDNGRMFRTLSDLATGVVELYSVRAKENTGSWTFTGDVVKNGETAQLQCTILQTGTKYPQKILIPKGGCSVLKPVKATKDAELILRQ